MDVASSDGDEAASSGVRGATLEQGDEPIDDAVGLQVAAAIRADHGTDGLHGQRQLLERPPQVGMQGNAPASALFGDVVADHQKSRPV
jgi:hypothetical protein